MIILNQAILSYQFYTYELPNGNKLSKSFGHGNGCNREFDEDCEAMRWDFLDAGKKWTEDLCNKDSDGDGKTNGLELGDPNCVWKRGDTPDYDYDISSPSDSSSITSRVMPLLSPPSLSPNPPSPN